MALIPKPNKFWTGVIKFLIGGFAALGVAIPTAIFFDSCTCASPVPTIQQPTNNIQYQPISEPLVAEMPEEPVKGVVVEDNCLVVPVENLPINVYVRIEPN